MTERRYDPTKAEWRTYVTPEAGQPDVRCPLCPSADPDRPTGITADMFDLVVMDNPGPPLRREPPDPSVTGSPLYRVEPACGAAEIVVYTDQHLASLADLPAPRLARLVDVWAHRYEALSARDEVAYVFIFENRGEAFGAPLQHPHTEIYGFPDIPPLPRQELAAAKGHLMARGTCVYCDVVAHERGDGARTLAQNPYFLAFVPFAPRMPYEVHILAHRHATSLLDLTDPERVALADVIGEVVRHYDRLFGFPLPYVMSMHQAPTDDDGEWLPISHLHLEFTPVHRAPARVLQLAGPELGAGAFVGDMTPEQMAEQLRHPPAAVS